MQINWEDNIEPYMLNGQEGAEGLKNKSVFHFKPN